MTGSIERRTCLGLASLGLLALLSACSGERVESTEAAIPVMVDCATADPASLSPFAVDAFQRDLAIDTPSRITEHLDQYPDLICRTLHSDRHGDLSPIAYAAAHRPDAHHIFSLLSERGAQPADALPIAVRRGDSRVVPWLLEHGVDPNAHGALVLAAHERDTRMVQRLLQAGADPRRTVTENPWIDDDGRTALHYAALHGAREMLESLLDSGAYVDALDHERRTPLAVAVLRQHTGVVRLLIERGAAPNRMRDEDIDRLRHLAKRYGMTEILGSLG